MRLRTVPAAYQRAHELPGWYDAFEDVTPESRWLMGPGTEGLDGLLGLTRFTDIHRLGGWPPERMPRWRSERSVCGGRSPLTEPPVSTSDVCLRLSMAPQIPACVVTVLEHLDSDGSRSTPFSRDPYGVGLDLGLVKALNLRHWRVSLQEDPCKTVAMIPVAPQEAETGSTSH